MIQLQLDEYIKMNAQANKNMFDAIEIVEEAIEISNDNQGIFTPSTSHSQNTANAWRIQENATR